MTITLKMENYLQFNHVMAAGEGNNFGTTPKKKFFSETPTNLLLFLSQ